MRFAISLFLSCTAFTYLAQRVELKTLDPILYFNDENGQLTVIDDSNWVRTYSVRGTLLASQKVLNKEINMQELKQEFVPVMLHKKLHFVERGCGRVFRFDQGMLERIDHSFSHRNQYDALIISFNDTLYCVGGYGFFTVKDHVTYFDESLGQWFLKNNSFKVKYQILDPLYLKKSSSLLVFGGLYVRENKNEVESNEIYKKVIEFNLKTKTWKYKGELNDDLIKFMHGRIFSNGEILIARNEILLFKVAQNSVHIIPYDKTTQHLYKFQKKMVVHRLVRTSQNLYINILDFRNESDFLTSNSNNVLQIFSHKENESQENQFYIIGFVVLLVVFLLISFVRYRLKRKKATLEIPVEVYSLLQVWKSSPNYSIELSDINQLVAYDNPELETLKKRREGLLKRLKTYLMENHRFEEYEVYTTEFSPRDKRIKLFKLHPKVVKWYNKVK